MIQTEKDWYECKRYFINKIPYVMIHVLTNMSSGRGLHDYLVRIQEEVLKEHNVTKRNLLQVYQRRLDYLRGCKYDCAESLKRRYAYYATPTDLLQETLLTHFGNYYKKRYLELYKDKVSQRCYNICCNTEL